MSAPRPRGEAEIVDAVIAAAAELFATTDPDSISLRRIAEAANVSYSLIHRHFGTKVDVVAATVRRHSEAFKPSPQGEIDPIQYLEEIAGHYLAYPAVARSLAWATLNGADSDLLVKGLADVERLVDQLAERTGDRAAAIQAFAYLASAVLGVGVFDRIVLTAGGDDSPAMRAQLIETTIAHARTLMQELAQP